MLDYRDFKDPPQEAAGKDGDAGGNWHYETDERGKLVKVYEDPDRPPLPDHFLPVPTRLRVDGWTPAKQRAFIEALADTGSVGEACRIVGKSRQSVYALRRRAANSMFNFMWDAAIRIGIERLREIALERATEGVAYPVWHRGEQVGERRVYSDRLLMFLIDRAPDLDRTVLPMEQIRQLWPAMLTSIDKVGEPPLDREALNRIVHGETPLRWHERFKAEDGFRKRNGPARW